MNIVHKTKFAALLAFVFVVATCFAGVAKAAAPTVTTTLSSDSTDVGQPVELTIVVHGAQGAKVPDNIPVDGLSIIHSGQQTQFQMQNFDVSTSVTHTYTVQPKRAGKFEIPAVTVEAGSVKLETKALTLSVGAGSGSGGTTASGSNANPNDGVAFAELVVPKETAYVGEVIPIEARIYFDNRARVNVSQPPTITCEGFTVQKLTQPRQEQVDRNGRSYSLITFKTAITPVKSGKLSAGPVALNYVAQIPQRRNRPRNGGMQDPFDDPFFNGMLGAYTQQQLEVTSPTVNLEVKPLPKQNQPADFSGAVGEFSLTSEASPLKLNIGDPITLKLKITGRGNFDLVSAPRMADEPGWRSYPPSNKFTADDDVGISGTKIFEMAVIPEEKKAKLPTVRFSYFDPRKEKYVSLTADRLPIVVEGQNPTPTPAPQSSVAVGQPSASATPKVAEANDIHYIVTGPAHWDKSFTPVFARPVFWEVQGGALFALLAISGIQLRQRARRDVLVRRQAELRREKAELMKTMQRTDIDVPAFYDAATRYIQIEAARNSLREPASIGPDEALAARSLDASAASAVQSLFDAHEEMRYAGNSAAPQKPSPAQRQGVMDALKQFENANDEPA